MDHGGLPLIRRVDLPADGCRLYASIAGAPYSFWLDSALPQDGRAGRSFLGCDPFLYLSATGDEVSFLENGRETRARGNPWDCLAALYRRYAVFPPGDWPLAGGVVGYFGYDLGRHLERLPALAAPLGLPDLGVGFYDVVVMLDRPAGAVYLVSTGLPETDPALARRRAHERLREMEARLATPPRVPPAFRPARAVASNFTPAAYREAVRRAVDYILAGDIFQVNLSQRFTARPAPAAWPLYLRLRELSPAPFGALLDFPPVAVASISPERFLELRNGRVETRPIKGTRPRGANPRQDAALRRELWRSAKDRAELTMITDLLRNDLGRACRYGTVRVPELFRLEEYATVFHLVSTVTGELRPGLDAVDLLRAAFPGGSVTGAPKVRAMEVIEELEPVRRGIYCGSLGYLSFNGNADLNIAIRTCVVAGAAAYYSAGGGLTADSDPQAEYQETMDKARAFLLAVAPGLEVEARGE